MSIDFNQFKWMSVEFESRLKSKRKCRVELYRELQKLDEEIAKMEEYIDYVILLRLKAEFKERICALKELQDEDIHKRMNCGEGLTGVKKQRLEKSISINPIIEKDEWLLDELNENAEFYQTQLELISKLNKTNNLS